MKLARVRIVLDVAVPFGYVSDGAAHEWEDDAIEFDVNENSCPGTHSLGRAIDQTIEWHEANSSCWGCALMKEQDLLEIVDIQPDDPTLENHPQGDWLKSEVVAFHAVPMFPGVK